MAYDPVAFGAADLIATLTGQAGATEHPAGSNLTRYGAATGVDGVPWCAIFIGWGLRQHGVDPAGFFGTTQWRYCPAIYQAARAAGRLVPAEQARPGDIVLYRFSGPVIQHVGVCLSNQPGARLITTIEGNTSAGTSGSQDNGGGVYRRQRPYSLIAGVARPRYASAPTSSTASTRTSPGRLAVDGDLGPATIRRWQQVMGTPVDGVISTPRSSLVVAVQAHLNKVGCKPPLALDGAGIRQDGRPTATIASLQRYLGIHPADGALDAPPSPTVQALQQRLNAGRF